MTSLGKGWESSSVAALRHLGPSATSLSSMSVGKPCSAPSEMGSGTHPTSNARTVSFTVLNSSSILWQTARSGLAGTHHPCTSVPSGPPESIRSGMQPPVPSKHGCARRAPAPLAD